MIKAIAFAKHTCESTDELSKMNLDSTSTSNTGSGSGLSPSPSRFEALVMNRFQPHVGTPLPPNPTTTTATEVFDPRARKKKINRLKKNGAPLPTYCQFCKNNGTERKNISISRALLIGSTCFNRRIGKSLPFAHSSGHRWSGPLPGKKMDVNK